ncbi:MAG: hypothetical protein DCC55_17910 [Chloroflexi bacterium]|nr:MAG: hypothetical protein DCC55_17910 [Chloroflexota bacterium]
MQGPFAREICIRHAWFAILGWVFILLCTPVVARAQGCIDHACVTVGSNLVAVDTNQSDLLNSLFTSLLGNSANIDVSTGNYNELLNGNIDLFGLLEELQVDLDLQSPGEALATQVTMGELLQAAIGVANQNGDTALALAFNDLLLDINGLSQEIKLGDLFDLQFGAESLTNVKLNGLDLVSGSVQLFNFAHVDGPTAALVLPGTVLSGLGLDSKIGQVTLNTRVLEPPTFVCGPESAVFNAAPMRLLLDVEVLDLALDTSGLESDLLGLLGGLLNILGDLANVRLDANATVSQLSLLVEIDRGEGVIQAINAVNNAVTIQATPGVAHLYLGQIDPNRAFDRTYDLSPADFDFTDIATLDLTIDFSGLPELLFSDVEIANVAIGAKAYADGVAEAATFQFTGPYPQTHKFVADSSTLDTLLPNLLSNLEINADVSLLEEGLGGLLSGLNLNALIDELLDGLLGLLQDPNGDLLNSLLGPILGDILNPLLDTLGLRLGEMGVTVNELSELCPDLSISKSHLGAFTVGATGSYIINVRNAGQAPTALPITVIDTLPGELSFVTASGVGWNVVSHVGQTVVLQNSQALSSGASLPLLTLTVNATAPGAVVNTATVTVTGDGNAANNSALDPTVINPVAGSGAPDLAISKSHSGDFAAGNLHNYTIEVQNVGNGATTGAITVVDTLPGGMTYVSHSGAGWQLAGGAGQALTFRSIAVIVPGNTMEPLVLTVFVGESAVGSVVNTATVSTVGDANAANNTATDPTVVNSGGGVAPDLALSKTHEGDFTAGNLHSYTLTVANVGAGATSGPITVVDALPAGMSYFSHSGNGWNLVSVAGQHVTLRHDGPLAGGGSLPVLALRVTVGEQAVGAVINTATVSTAGDADPANDTASDTTVVRSGGDGPFPDLAINKSHGGDFTQGMLHSYTIVVQNVGASATTGVIQVADTLPAGMNYVAHSGAGWTLVDLSDSTATFEHQNVVAPNSMLPPLLLHVIAGSAGAFTNTAAVSTTGDMNVANNLAFDSTVVRFDRSGDDDNDGILNEAECSDFPNCPDTDGDGTPDYLDPDDDGDGVWTQYECPDHPDCPDTDGDGNPDYLDPDDDGDGKPTITENADPNGDGNPDDALDSDGDGIPDYLDPDDGVSGANQMKQLIPFIMNG